MRAVLFDFSGTLFDPAQVVDGPALAERARRHGAQLDEETAAVHARRILAYADTPQALALRAGCDLSPERHRAGWSRVAGTVPGVSRPVAEAFYNCIVDPERWRPYPDTGPVLAALRAAGVSVGVVSNCGFDLREAFARHGLDGFVDDYTLSCEYGIEKPDGELFRRACAALGVTPARALMVGDDPRTDGGAARAGIATYVLPPPAPGRLEAVLRLCDAGGLR